MIPRADNLSPPPPRYNQLTARLLAAILVSAAFFASCDLFNATQEEDLQKKIDQKVWEHNAPHLAAAMLANPAEGQTSALPSPVKLRVPFSVSFTPNPSYQFIRWQALGSPNDKDELPGDIVRFDNPQAYATGVEIRREIPVWIKPLCQKRPVIVDCNMKGRTSDVVALNSPIKVYFDLPVKDDSLVIGTTIKISGRYAGGEDIELNDYFVKEPLTDNGTRLILRANRDKYTPPQLKNWLGSRIISVTFSHLIEMDYAGRSVTMEKDDIRYYNTDNKIKDVSPEILNLRGAREKTSPKLFYKETPDTNADIIQYRRLILPKANGRSDGKFHVYLLLEVPNTDGWDVDTFTVQETKIKAEEENPLNYPAKTIDAVRANNSDYSALTDLFNVVMPGLSAPPLHNRLYAG